MDTNVCVEAARHDGSRHDGLLPDRLRPDALRLQLAARLDALRAELALGERRMGALQAEREALRDTLLRITGAVAVLEEQLGAPPGG